MTKRGRAVLLSLVATPLVLVALAFGISAGGATATSTSTPLAKVTVVSGETLWDVAQQIAPTADPRDVIADIESVNRLSSASIYPGEQLLIPAQYGALTSSRPLTSGAAATNRRRTRHRASL